MAPAERGCTSQRHITDWQVSGVSGSLYCKQQSLIYHQFVYLRRKLSAIKAYPNPEEAKANSGFARVVSVPGAGAIEGQTVSLSGGVSIAGLHAGNIELLGAVLRQL
jgi:hypothetical protein